MKRLPKGSLGRVDEATVTLESRLFFNLRPHFDDAPNNPSESLFRYLCLINFGSCFAVTSPLFIGLFSTIFSDTSVLVLDWLHNCTDVGEAPNQNGGEIDDAPT